MNIQNARQIEFVYRSNVLGNLKRTATEGRIGKPDFVSFVNFSTSIVSPSTTIDVMECSDISYAHDIVMKNFEKCGKKKFWKWKIVEKLQCFEKCEFSPSTQFSVLSVCGHCNGWGAGDVGWDFGNCLSIQKVDWSQNEKNFCWVSRWYHLNLSSSIKMNEPCLETVGQIEKIIGCARKLIKLRRFFQSLSNFLKTQVEANETGWVQIQSPLKYYTINPSLRGFRR